MRHVRLRVALVSFAVMAVLALPAAGIAWAVASTAVVPVAAEHHAPVPLLVPTTTPVPTTAPAAIAPLPTTGQLRTVRPPSPATTSPQTTPPETMPVGLPPVSVPNQECLIRDADGLCGLYR